MALDFLKKKNKKKEEAAAPNAVAIAKSTVSKEKGKHVFAVQPSGVLIRLVMSSKAGRVRDQERYIFEVSPRANKIEIKKAFYTLYGVMPLSVATCTYKQKRVRFARREGTRKQWKKATISVDAKHPVTII
ncbi:50S ribosomal protein L23 [Candidatus Uhrbacteria bacterium]|nr:50S ribosomal protein L23 [Candidatus Uhrbacteria bacterium]